MFVCMVNTRGVSKSAIRPITESIGNYPLERLRDPCIYGNPLISSDFLHLQAGPQCGADPCGMAAAARVPLRAFNRSIFPAHKKITPLSVCVLR